MTTTNSWSPATNRFYKEAQDKLTAAGQMDWVAFGDGSVIAQVGGTATSFSAVVERSGVDPGSTVDTTSALAGDTGFVRTASEGVKAQGYMEAGQGWWRIKLTDVAGGYAYLQLSGKAP